LIPEHDQYFDGLTFLDPSWPSRSGRPHETAPRGRFETAKQSPVEGVLLSGRSVHAPASSAGLRDSAFKLRYPYGVEPSETGINLIGFDSVYFQKIIFALRPSKLVQVSFGMGYDERVIIKFIWNEGADAR
jgi:hypothetical protein